MKEQAPKGLPECQINHPLANLILNMRLIYFREHMHGMETNGGGMKTTPSQDVNSKCLINQNQNMSLN